MCGVTSGVALLAVRLTLVPIFRGSPRPVTAVRQVAAADCGIACLQMILRAFGRYVPTSELRSALQPGRDGVTALCLVETARSYGLDAKGYQVTAEAVPHLSLPVIIHCRRGHFAVVDAVRETSVRVVDPSAGVAWHSRAQLSNLMTGVALEFVPTPSFRHQRKSASVVRHLIMHTTPGGTTLCLGLTATLALALALPPLIAVAAGLLSRVDPQQGLVRSVMALALAFVGGWCVALCEARLVNSTGTSHSAAVRNSLEHASRRWFLERRAADVEERIIQADPAIGHSFVPVLSIVMVAVGSLIVARMGAVWIAWYVVALALAVGMAVLDERNDGARQYAGRAARRALRAVLLQGMTQPGQFDHVMLVARWSVERYRVAAIAVKAIVRGRLLRLLHFVILGVATIVAVRAGYGGFTDSDKAGSLDLLLQVLFLAWCTAQLSLVVSGAMAWYGATERLNNLRGSRGEMAVSGPNPENAADLVASGVVLRVQDLSLRYPPSPAVFSSPVTFSIREGERVALVGGPRSGKTTLARALLGTLPTLAADVRFDERPLAEIAARDRGRLVRGVSQDAVLPDGTIANALRVANPGVPFERLRDACQLVGLIDDIDAMPLRFSTLLWNDGGTLSRSERQLLRLAAAIATAARFLVLDDPIESLSVGSARCVLERLSQIDTTLIVLLSDTALLEGLGFRLIPFDQEVIPAAAGTLLPTRNGRVTQLP